MAELGTATVKVSLDLKDLARQLRELADRIDPVTETPMNVTIVNAGLSPEAVVESVREWERRYGV